MHTPEWYGTIGIMNSAHMHRRGVFDALQPTFDGLRYALLSLRLQRPAEKRARRHGAATPPYGRRLAVPIGPRTA